MAINSFNNFTDLDAVNGVFQQEPRVFAHDAKAIVIGAINNSAPNHGLTMTNAGATYSVNDVITLNTLTGSGSSATVKVLAISGTPGSGVITNYEVVNFGSGYAVGDTVDDGGAGVAAFTINNINIPDTAKRGACVYVGNGGGNITVIMESGSEVTFSNVVSGQFLPILIKRLVSVSGTVANVLALY